MRAQRSFESPWAAGAAFCRSLLEESGVLLLPASVYRSELMAAPSEHFRIGFGRAKVFEQGLTAMEAHLEARYPQLVS